MKLFLRDRNQELCDCWEYYFKNDPDVHVSCGDIFEDGPWMNVDGIVSPANSFGFMDGGIDMVYSLKLGWGMSDDLRQIIHNLHDGELLIGQAEVVDIAHTNPDTPIRWLISAPTMRTPEPV